MRAARATALLATALLASTWVIPSPAAGDESFPDDVPARAATRIEEHRADAPAAKIESALATALEDGEATAVIEAIDADDADDAEKAVEAAGGTVERRVDELLEARVDAAIADELSRAPSVRSIRAPRRPFPLAVTAEAVAVSHADDRHAEGTRGAGAEVAVIDIGFAGLTPAIAADEIPDDAVVVPGGCDDPSATSHGTAVAEIVHDMAPDAGLHLLCIDDDLDLVEAVNYSIAQDIDIINFSLGFHNTGPGDGTGEPGSPNAEVARAADAGILWVSAAGNEAERHWAGPRRDHEGDGWLEWAGSDETMDITLTRDPTTIYLKWDDWAAVPADDYDLYLVDADFNVIAMSRNDQTSGARPVEELSVEGRDGTYALVVDHYRGPGAATSFDLFLEPAGTLEYTSSARSLSEPADSTHAVAVGAACWADEQLESFSSRGPTLDGRSKPDIVGYDRSSTMTFGRSRDCSSGFAGTSAATPPAAGAAALLLSEDPTRDRSALATALVQRAGGPGGLLRLSAVPEPDDEAGDTSDTSDTGETDDSGDTDDSGGGGRSGGGGGGSSSSGSGSSSSDSDDDRSTSSTTGAGATNSTTVRRLAGDTRLTTAIQLSRHAFPDGTATSVVVADSRGFADAISGAPLAHAAGGPLLVTPGALDPGVRNEITRVARRGATIYLLGGNASVAPDVDGALRSAGFQVVRLAGQNRFATAVAVARRIGGSGPVFVATGTTYADALSAGAAAARTGGAIALTDGRSLPDETAAFLQERRSSAVYAIGGPAAAAVDEDEAVAGASRFDTAVRVARRFFTSPRVVTFASGEGFADALAGGAHAANNSAPLILVASLAVPSPVAGYVGEIRTNVNGAYVYGGTAAVAGEVGDRLEDLLQS